MKEPTLHPQDGEEPQAASSPLPSPGECWGAYARDTPACTTSAFLPARPRGPRGPVLFILFAGLWLLQHLGKGDLGATLTLSPHGSGRHGSRATRLRATRPRACRRRTRGLWKPTLIFQEGGQPVTKVTSSPVPGRVLSPHLPPDRVNGPTTQAGWLGKLSHTQVGTSSPARHAPAGAGSLFPTPVFSGRQGATPGRTGSRAHPPVGTP